MVPGEHLDNDAWTLGDSPRLLAAGQILCSFLGDARLALLRDSTSGSLTPLALSGFIWSLLDGDILLAYILVSVETAAG